jgi:hypothetical protein
MSGDDGVDDAFFGYRDLSVRLPVSESSTVSMAACTKNAAKPVMIALTAKLPEPMIDVQPGLSISKAAQDTTNPAK